MQPKTKNTPIELETANEAKKLLSDALDCLIGETPEDMSKKQAKDLIIARITRFLRYGTYGSIT